MTVFQITKQIAFKKMAFKTFTILMQPEESVVEKVSIYNINGYDESIKNDSSLFLFRKKFQFPKLKQHPFHTLQAARLFILAQSIVQVTLPFLSSCFVLITWTERLTSCAHSKVSYVSVGASHSK